MTRILAPISVLALLALAACNEEKAPEGNAESTQQESTVPQSGTSSSAGGGAASPSEPAPAQ